jgi:hypothetical protein
MTIIVNMTKALEIKKDMVRRERAPLLAALDIEMMKALESGDEAKKTEIAEKKQALRDATDDPVLTQATTPDELKAATPQALIS